MFKILYLEDNKFDIDLTKIELKKTIPDCIIDVANTISEAKNLLITNPDYDVAVLDLHLPDGNGTDVLLAVREGKFQTAVIILTGSGNEDAAIAALKAGADDYISKNQGYLKKLPGVINSSIQNFRKNQLRISSPLKVLYVEWNKPDIDFTIRHMKRYAPHIVLEVVSSAQDALNILPDSVDAVCPFDVLLMDYRLPGLNALDTIKIIRQERKLPISIVLVTGHGNEEIAVKALHLGADEYLVKRENYLFRLPSLLASAYNRYEMEKKRAALLESESKYRLLAENIGDVIFILDMDLKYKYVSPSVKELRGFEVEEALKQELKDVLTPESYIVAHKLLAKLLPPKNKELDSLVPHEFIQLEMNRKDGTTVWTEVRVSIITDKNNMPIGLQGVTRDISERKAALDQLFKSREEYKSFFEEDLTGDFISTVEGKLLNCNNAYLQILGLMSKEQALSLDLNTIYPSKEVLNEMLDKLRKNKKLINYEHNLIRPDGRVVHALGNIIGRFNANGELETLKGYLIDDTERKRAIEELRKLSRAVVQSPASVVITDTNGNIEYVNPKFTEVTGYTFNEAIGENPRILKSGNLPNEYYANMWKNIKSGKTWSGEFENKRKDGTIYWENASISPIKNIDGITTHFLAVKEDITKKKEYERELILARDQAQESNRLKSAFLATMSHELRTPLNAIIGFSGLMSEDVPLSDLVQYGKTINKSGNHLLNIIEDIFTISLLQAGQSKIVLEEFNLSEIFNTLIQYANIELDNRKKLHLNLRFNPVENHSEIRIRTDKTKLIQVLINFIKNAVEYTETGYIEIGYSIEKNELAFFVKDSGIGIPESKLDVIFERFRQIDETLARIHGGVGLGLSICSEVAKMLQGKVWAESIVGKGSTFFFKLANIIQNNPKNTEQEQSTKFPDFKDKTILIVEDEETNFMLLDAYLNPTKANIIWSHNGEESIEACRKNSQIDLVLMDIRMQGMDGIEASNEIKKIRPEIKIIAQTAFALANEKEKFINSGCDDYLPKPIMLNDFMKILKKHIK